MIKGINQTGFLFKAFVKKNQTPFEKLFEIFKELITYTSGDFDEAINWLKELDKEFILTSEITLWMILLMSYMKRVI